MKERNNVLDKLKTDLLSYLVKQHKLPNNIKLWTRSDFIRAAKLLSEKLSHKLISLSNKIQLIDTYISNSTLERIFKYGYDLPNPIDKRRLHTLNKLAMCLDYESFGGFSYVLENDLDIDFKQFIIDANTAEFLVYRQLPVVNFKNLRSFFIIDSPAFNQIYKVVNSHAENGISLNDEKNPSYQEILDVEVLKKQPDSVHIKTKECWYLKWHSKNKNVKIKYYNKSNTQLYILDNTIDGWKIRINHYPYDFDS